MRSKIGILTGTVLIAGILGCGSKTPSQTHKSFEGKTVPQTDQKTDQKKETPTAPAFDLHPKWASAAGRDSFGAWADITVENTVQRLRFIPPGTFRMGSPEKEPSSGKDEALHTVTISQGFWLGDSEVTQHLWKVVMGDNPAGSINDPTCPVDTVSWIDAEKFYRKLNILKGGLYASFPTESQWEYACRSGTTAMFSGEPSTMSWSYKRRSFPVKTKPANAWGLHDMHGNVWEWCEDLYGPYPVGPVTNPLGATTGTLRVMRGGSWQEGYAYARSARRGKQVPSSKGQNLGLRICIPATSNNR
jgi:formylglycine-generating enzyme required for sulfatase activity